MRALASWIGLLGLAACAAPADDTDETDDTEVVDETDETDDTEVVDETDVPTPVLVVSESFETPELTEDGGFYADIGAPWGALLSRPPFAAVGILRPASTAMTVVEPLAPPADGRQVAWLAATLDVTDPVGTRLQRRVVDVAEVGTTYRARFALGARLDIDPPAQIAVVLGVIALSDGMSAPSLTGGHGVLLDLEPGELSEGVLESYELAWTVPEAAAGAEVDLAFYAGSGFSGTQDRQLLLDAVEVWIEPAP